MNERMNRAMIKATEALSVAETDAVTVYRDLTRHRIELRFEDDSWHVEYWFRGTGRFHTGGGPHYVIDATTGQIISKKYYQ